MKSKYQLINNIFGWAAFAISLLVYFLTIEPTASFWDCGEFIATCFKLEVGHPPGAPLFMMLGRFFTLFAGGNTEMVPVMVNVMSAMMSAFTILFLFWSITHLAKKMLIKNDDSYNLQNIIAIIGAGLVGGLAFTFSDSFWFSAVEGEVYASSSFFSAIVFWAILKWENCADEAYSNRWLILIAYLCGLSIGVHLLNLLAIPAIVFVYYFKKYDVTRKGVILTSAIAVIILAFVMYGLIPYTFIIGSWFELLCVNSFGLPYNSGLVVWVIILVAGLSWAIYYSVKKNKVLLNTALLCVAFILIGYSSFAAIIIRSNAELPMDENNPENPFSLLSYLNREQYGDRPLVYGQYYNAPIDKENPMEDGSPIYAQVDGKYVVTEYKPIYNYDSRFMTFFPRMWSPQRDHISAYKSWATIEGTPIKTTNNQGEQEVLYKPSFGENLKYFFVYQMGFMYGRYFMWNFAGRQNDIQGHGGILKGNWITGIPFIDEGLIGPQKDVPAAMKNNKGNNKYYMLPLLLGLIGLYFNMRKTNKDFWIVMMLFFFTGMAIVIYLNQYPFQPRERDYAYVGSFYAFTIWIGLGVIALYKLLSKRAPAVISAVVISAACLFLVPGIMANQNWDDHDRSQRYTARDFASNYLNSCAKNAILFTNGDNDTFPLWYAQEVEGIRTDIRVVNLSLFNTDWYITQMKRKAYDSDPIPTTLQREHYMEGKRDIVYLVDDKNSFLDEKYAKNKNFETQYKLLHDALIQVAEKSEFPKQHQKDFDLLKKGYQSMNIYTFKNYATVLAQKESIEKFKLNESSITAIKQQVDKLIEAIGNEYVPVDAAMKFLASSNSTRTRGERDMDYLPSKKFSVRVDKNKVIQNKTVREQDRDKIVDWVDWNINKSYILKSEMMVMDMLAANNWDRPIYFAITVGSDGYMNLEPYFQLEGLAYRLVPLRPENTHGQIGRVAADIMYENLMNKFKWGGIDNPKVYLDENNLRMIMNIRNNFARLAQQLLDENKKDKAIAVLDKCEKLMPNNLIPYNYFNLGIAEVYYKAGETEKANKIINILTDITLSELKYYFNAKGEYAGYVDYEKKRSMAVLQELVRLTKIYKQDELNKKLDKHFQELLPLYNQTTSKVNQDELIEE